MPLLERPVFTVTTGKPSVEMAAEMAEAIKEVIYGYADKVPLVLALGVLRVVEHEIMSDHT